MVLKRDGKTVDFQPLRIYKAISKAFIEVDKEMTDEDRDIAVKICRSVDSNKDWTVDEIQDVVIASLKTLGRADVSDAYQKYRQMRDEARKNTIEDNISSIVSGGSDYWNTENANKNPRLNTTVRDYIAGEVSKDITMRRLLPPDIREANAQGIIHFHDADYFIQKEYNCFNSSTKFVTDEGVRTFRDCKDGEIVNVIDKDGVWREATVRCYGEQPMNEIKIQSGRSVRKIICTSNHRWILSDGTVTTELREGMKLYPLHSVDYSLDNLTPAQAKAFCLGFGIGDGTDTSKGYLKIRLCGNKVRFANIFSTAGYNVTYPEAYNGDGHILIPNVSKQSFLDAFTWRYMSADAKRYLFLGYYSADGAIDSLRTATTDKRILEMIKEISSVAGYYVSSITNAIRNTNYKEDSFITYIHFRKRQNPNNLWSVKSIKPYRGNLKQYAWCVEEPITHSFTLDGGVVTGNCCLVNLEDMLQNGTVISETTIDKPHSFYTACNITTQIIAQVASNQYGGQSFSLTHLAPFVDISRKSIYEAVLTETEMLLGIGRDSFDDSTIANAKLVTEKRVKEEVSRGIQTIQYQLITLNTTNGQAPFVTMFMYLNEAKNEQEKNDLAMVIEEVLTQRIQGVKGKDGSWIAPAFPKLIYVLESDNITEDSKYWYLTELAAKCTSKRLVPDYISEKKMLDYKGDVYTCMGCRSFLTPDRFTDVVGNISNAKNYTGKHKYYGRFNQGVVTINLPDIALSSGGDIDKFWELFEERTELCHKALMVRHKRLLGTTSDVAPILWQYGAIARLQPGEKIDKLLYHGYSTISLGYAGLYECVKYMTGHSHSDEGIGTAFGLEVMQALNDKCTQWKKESNMDFSLYGTPLESTTYKFAKTLKKRFGDDVFMKIDGHDRDYVTNSYHIVVTEEIDAFNKLRIESMFQELSPGGAISYVETPDMSHNIPALLEVIKYMYENIMYAEINTKSCHCEKCGYDGNIPLLDEDGKFVWRCPNCGNEDIDSMDISFRVCGYIGKVSHGLNKGRLNEVHERVKHIDDKECIDA